MLTPVEEALQYIDIPFELHQYQVEDINAAATSKCYGLYLAMGLGKSIESIAVGVYKLIRGATSVIVICPASLITEWVDNLKSLELETCDYRGTPRGREKLSLDADFIVMSPQIYQKDYERLAKLTGMFFIIDESSNLCNHQNVLYKMLRGGIRTVEEKIKLSSGFEMPVKKQVQYPRVMDECCLLTGTPITSSPLGAYGLIAITTPDSYVNYSSFYRQHVEEENEYGQPVKFKALDRINEALTENAVIREVGDHLDLPELIYKVVRYDLTTAHKKLYKQLVEEQILTLKDGSILDATQAQVMYHMCQKFIFCPVEFSKPVAGLDVIDALVEDTHRRLIFNKYVGTNDLMMRRYNAGGCYGSVTRKKQEHYIKEFKEGRLDSMVANPRSAGFGLNFQICNQIIFPELPLTRADFLQAVARCWRQGQKNPVIVTLTVAKGTIQTTLLKRVMDKSDVVERVINSKSSLRNDLMGL